MQLAHPQVLWLLAILPLLAWWWLHRRRAALLYPALQTLAPLPAGRSKFVEAMLLGLRLAVMALLIVALARPRWPDEQTRIPTRSTALMLVLDVSNSMAEKDFTLDGAKVTRLEAARQTLRQFIQGDLGGLGDGIDARRTEDMLGLLTFAARAEQVCPPTLSHAQVLQLLDEAVPVGQPPDASTNIGDALAEAIALLQRARPAEKTIILLSDGEHNVPSTVVADALKPRQSARLAQALGVKVHTILVGPDAELNSAARETLSDVATMTGGLAFRAGDSEALRAVCQQLDQAERTRVESFHYYRYHEAYPWFGLACVVLTFVGLTLEGTRWLRVP